MSDDKRLNLIFNHVKTELTPEEVIYSLKEYGRMGLLEFLTKGLFWLFAACIAAAFVLFFLQGFGKTSLPESVLNKIAYLTIGQVVAVILLIVRGLLGAGSQKGSGKTTKKKP